MKFRVFRVTEEFRKQFLKLPPHKQQAAETKFRRFFKVDPHHPSLRIKKLPETDFYYGRIDGGYRFVFKIEGDTIISLAIGPHEILDTFRQ